MAKGIEQTAHFRIPASARIGMLCKSLYALAMMACWLSDLYLLARLVFIGVILICWWLENRRMTAALTYLRYTGNIGWQVSSDGENYLDASILDTTVITSAVIFLHYKTENQAKKVLLIGKDALLDSDFRRLTVRLTLSLHGRER